MGEYKWELSVYLKLKQLPLLTLTVIFLGSKFIPKFCIPLANFDNGLVNVFNCFKAFSLCDPLRFNVKSRCPVVYLYSNIYIIKKKKLLSTIILPKITFIFHITGTMTKY